MLTISDLDTVVAVRTKINQDGTNNKIAVNCPDENEVTIPGLEKLINYCNTKNIPFITPYHIIIKYGHK